MDHRANKSVCLLNPILWAFCKKTITPDITFIYLLSFFLFATVLFLPGFFTQEGWIFAKLLLKACLLSLLRCLCDALARAPLWTKNKWIQTQNPILSSNSFYSYKQNKHFFQSSIHKQLVKLTDVSFLTITPRKARDPRRQITLATLV